MHDFGFHPKHYPLKRFFSMCRMNGSFSVQLIDWGQSATANDSNILDGWQYYRPHPPERVLQLPSGAPLDVWAMGVVVLHMMTRSGQFPDILDEPKSNLETYLAKLETLAGCIPRNMLPRNWEHDSDGALHVRSTVKER